MEDTKKIHLADDDEDDRTLLKEAFEEIHSGIEVIESEDGKELLDKLKDEEDLSDSVIVIDMNMPKMNGLETVKVIKEDPELADIPTVMLSTSDNPELIKKAMDAGVDQFLTKPNSFRALIDIAKKIFMRFFSSNKTLL